MSCLYYNQNKLFIEEVSLKEIADLVGTPCYVYSRRSIENNWLTFDKSLQNLPHRICYAVKANSNLTILHLLAKLYSGFDIVSLGELEKVVAAGGDPQKIIFSGVGKTEKEIEKAIQTNIYCFNVESEAELERLQMIADKMQVIINIGLRINPNVNPQTHAYISTGLKENKFGIEPNQVITLCQKIKNIKAVRLIGLACHIGSQLVDLKPFLLALDCLLEIYQNLTQLGFTIEHIDIGGGLGISYQDENPPTIQAYATALQEKLKPYPLQLILEPGRSILGNAGVLLTRIEYLKHTSHKNFAIVDAGMNDLLRPALYQAWQNILPIELNHAEKKIYDIAGPLCESADFLGKDRNLALSVGDFLAVDTVGAYGFCMSSNYNSRPRPAEILVDKKRFHLIRQRETIKDLYASEIDLLTKQNIP